MVAMCYYQCPEAFAKDAGAVGEKACHLSMLGIHGVHFWICLIELFGHLCGGWRTASN